MPLASFQQGSDTGICQQCASGSKGEIRAKSRPSTLNSRTAVSRHPFPKQSQRSGPSPSSSSSSAPPLPAGAAGQAAGGAAAQTVRVAEELDERYLETVVNLRQAQKQDWVTVLQRKLVERQDVLVAQGGGNGVFFSSHEKFHTVFLKPVGNVSDKR